uniref:AbiH family protein n=1 Tax=Flavobacterium sp. TaxID=239 RepID=UPI002623074E
MNRLVIIGNGFDLAHGLPTGYCNFINWYWERVLNILSSTNNLNEVKFEDNLLFIRFAFKESSWLKANNEYKKVKNYSDLNKFVSKFSESYDPQYYKQYDRCRLNFNNNFFKIICDKH